MDRHYLYQALYLALGHSSLGSLDSAPAPPGNSIAQVNSILWHEAVQVSSRQHWRPSPGSLAQITDPNPALCAFM